MRYVVAEGTLTVLVTLPYVVAGAHAAQALGAACRQKTYRLVITQAEIASWNDFL
jgi:hypothetical protein